MLDIHHNAGEDEDRSHTHAAATLCEVNDFVDWCGWEVYNGFMSLFLVFLSSTCKQFRALQLGTTTQTTNATHQATQYSFPQHIQDAARL